MKLLFIIKSLHAPGGAERVLADVAGALAGRGHEVTIGTFDNPATEAFYPLAKPVRLEALGLGNIRENTTPRELFARIAGLRCLLKRERPDVAAGFMHSAYIPLSIAAINSGVPTIASEHTAIDHYRGRKAEALLIWATAPLQSAFTTTSERVRRGFPRSIADRMTIIPNPVAIGRPRRSRAVDRPGSKHILLTVGGLREEKGQIILLRAFASLVQSFPQWHLRIVGEGPLRTVLEAAIRELGLSDRVTLVGAVKNVAPEYEAAHLFVMPSSYESFGLATAEALASGLPAVGFAGCPGTNELIQPGVNGLLAPGLASSEALAQTMAELMASESLRNRMGLGAQRSVDQFQLDAVANRWEQVLVAAETRTN